jgi:LysR family transcriptional regulator, nitrogen assimilation regulatory protein
MELRQFRYFISIADMGSVSRASRVLHIAQPALSQQISQLEAELGHKLLIRRHDGVLMTEQGQVFYRHAQRMLKQLSNIESELTQCATQLGGTVTIGLPQSTASQYAFALLAKVQSRHPGIALEFFDELSGNLLRGLDSGRLDIAIVVNDDDAAQLNARALFDERLFLVSHPTMAPRQHSLDAGEIGALPLALPGYEHGCRGQVTATAYRG